MRILMSAVLCLSIIFPQFITASAENLLGAFPEGRYIVIAHRDIAAIEAADWATELQAILSAAKKTPEWHPAIPDIYPPGSEARFASVTYGLLRGDVASESGPFPHHLFVLRFREKQAGLTEMKDWAHEAEPSERKAGIAYRWEWEDRQGATRQAYAVPGRNEQELLVADSPELALTMQRTARGEAASVSDNLRLDNGAHVTELLGPWWWIHINHFSISESVEQMRQAGKTEEELKEFWKNLEAFPLYTIQTYYGADLLQFQIISRFTDSEMAAANMPRMKKRFFADQPATETPATWPGNYFAATGRAASFECTDSLLMLTCPITPDMQRILIEGLLSASPSRGGQR